jgi:hypothetical protein
MNIHFTKQFPWGEPTYFIEKIWKGIALNNYLINKTDSYIDSTVFKREWPYNSEWWPIYLKCSPKIHTIRVDKNNRWKAGIHIHFQQWTEKPYNSKCYHFAPLIPCMSVQKIRISWSGNHVLVFVDDMLILKDQLLKLAQNDGFDSIESFFKWFDKDFTGKIIHWTDLKY